MPVLMNDIRRVLDEGGFVRYDWRTGRKELITTTGRSMRIDGRTYQAFLRKHTAELVRTESGNTESKDLIIEWRHKTNAELFNEYNANPQVEE